MSDDSSKNRQSLEKIKELLARASIVRAACELDLLVFLYRHPRALLTNEQLALFVGYEMKLVAASIETFIAAGLLERTQNQNHAARMYRLVLNGPHGGGLKALLELASTRKGRGEILAALGPGQPRAALDISQKKKRLHAVG